MTTISSLGVGSGLDLNSLLDQLQKGENQKLTPISNEKAGYQARISAFGTLKSALTRFQDAAAALSDPATFQAVKSTVDGDAVRASTSNETPPGDYRIHVDQRATASSVATLGIADDSGNLGTGTVTLTLGSGDTLAVHIDADNSSLTDIRDAINAENGGVRAALVNDGSDHPYRLAISAADTGTDAAVTAVQFSGDLSDGLSLDGATRIDARNATLTINGIQIESPGNRVEDAIQGVTLNINEGGDATLRVSRDDDAIKGAVGDFVDAYNNLQKTLGGLTGYDADSDTAGALLGNSTVRTVEARLRGVLSGAVGDGEYSLLSHVGVQLQLDGSLKIDEDKLSDVTAHHLGALSQFFSGDSDSDGLGAALDAVVGKMVGDGGLLANATEGLSQTVDSLGRQYQRTQERINATMAHYRDQFSQLDSMIAKMNSTSDYLKQQFDAMNQMRSGG